MSDQLRPPLGDRATTATVIQLNDEPGNDQLRPPLGDRATTATVNQLNDEPGKEGDQSKSEAGNLEHVVDPLSRPSYLDLFLLFCIFIMLFWPWIFFGAVWAKHGVQMTNGAAKVVKKHPHAATYIITLVCSIISMFVSALFSFAIIRFAQEMVTRRPTRPFHLKVLLAFRHQTWPWGRSWEEVKYLATGNRWWPTILVILCLLTFPHLVSTTTSLITPIPFNRTATLIGNELDFSSTDTACLDWYRAHPKSDDCDWQPYKNQLYTSCLGENQMVDVLESGRGNILEFISNNTQSLTFSQLGGKDGLHFLGSIRGVLPMGPNGIPAFDTLRPSPFSDPEIVEGMEFYNYTLNHQGLASNISCSYLPTSPVSFASNNITLSYNVPSCAALGQSRLLTRVDFLTSVVANNTLMYWACQSTPNNTRPTSYSVYLRGYRGSYDGSIGNITCTVSPIRPATYPVTYQSTSRIFSAGDPLPANESATYSPTAFSLIVNNSFIGLGGVISQGQNFDSNLVAESVITFGVKSFGLKPYEKSETYLRLYERMIQGILEYETTYIRLIYATVPNPPPSCIREVTGSVNYEVLGWYVNGDNIGYLIPLTVINLAAFVALLLAVISAKHGNYLPALHPRPVTYDRKYHQEEVPDEWKEKIAFRPTSILKEEFEGQVQPNIVDGGTGFAKAGASEVVEVAKN